jgi:hypothetical protein
MNKKVMTVIILAVIALGIVYLYSFGPLANRGQAVQPNPESLKPTVGQVPTSGTSEYHNRDLKENYYRIRFPQTWQVKSGSVLGSYFFSFSTGMGSVELADVPENTTLELFVLSQEEPRLKKEVPGYERKIYQKLAIGGSDSYELTYTSTLNGQQYENVRIYITGQDRAGVITMTVPEKEFTSFSQAVDAVIASFNWENQ